MIQYLFKGLEVISISGAEIGGDKKVVNHHTIHWLILTSHKDYVREAECKQNASVNYFSFHSQIGERGKVPNK